MKKSDKIISNSLSILNSLKLKDVKNQLKIIKKINVKEPMFKIAISRTFTLESQIDFINLALNILPANIKTKLGYLNNVEQELNNKNSELLRWQPDLTIVLWRIEELFPEINKDITFTDNKFNNYNRLIKKRIKSLVSNYFKVSIAPLVISNLPSSHLSMSFNNARDLKELIDSINIFIKKFIRTRDNVSLFDFCGWSNFIGKEFVDTKMDYYARQGISMYHINSFSTSLARTVRPFLYTSAKAIAVDLDNVLWGGVLGEDGCENLKISHDFPGNVYRQIQKKILLLKENGFLIFLLSKNNYDDVKEAFKILRHMPIKLKDFDDVKVNWNEKYKNLKEIANKYNLGLSSFVFLDDQKFEQDQMQYHLREVNVLGITGDPLNILEKIGDCSLLDKQKKTNEDSLRNKDYKANIKRNKLKNIKKNPNDFLESLNLVSKVFEINKNQIDRVFDMLNKTNQFNLRTFRKSKKEIISEVNNKNYLSLLISLSDRFGDQGIIGLIVGKLKKDDSVFIENFLISCRAIGRGAEEALFYIFLKKLKNKNIKTINAEYVKSKKNSQVKDLYSRLGLKIKLNQKNKTSYEAKLPISLNKPKWIKVHEK